MTQKTGLRERRAKRVADSARRQQDHVQQKLDSAETPVDLLGANYVILRGRLVQYERKALAAVGRAKTSGDIEAARERLARTRAEVQRITDEAVAHMARLADQIHTERR